MHEFLRVVGLQAIVFWVFCSGVLVGYVFRCLLWTGCGVRFVGIPDGAQYVILIRFWACGSFVFGSVQRSFRRLCAPRGGRALEAGAVLAVTTVVLRL